MGPPTSVIRIEGRTFVYQPAPHLTEGADWHTAYAPMVDRVFASSDVAEPLTVPAYPLLFAADPSGLLFEIGAYWEGALYCLTSKVGTSNPLARLCELSDLGNPKHCSTAEQMFLAIWNSHGQMKWLKAHLLRERLLTDFPGVHEDAAGIRRLAETTGSDQLTWLASFVDQHREEGRKYPNPYFGGTNPLHLGLFAGIT